MLSGVESSFIRSCTLCSTFHVLGWCGNVHHAVGGLGQCLSGPVSLSHVSGLCLAEPAPGSTTKQILPRKRQKPFH